MAATEVLAPDAAQQLVANHLKNHFSLDGGAVSLSPIAPENLPPGAQQFYAERKGMHGHGVYHYVVLGEQVYCSGVGGDFGRLLKDYRYFERKDLNAAQVMHLYRLLVLPQQTMVLDRSYPQFPQVKPPTIDASDQGLSLTFFTSQGIPLEPRLQTVTVSRDYRVDVRTGDALKPQ